MSLVDVKVSLSGRWKWTPARPSPPWDKLKEAKVWHHRKHQELREALGRPPLRLQAVPSGDDDVSVVKVQTDVAGEQLETSLKMYRAGEGEERDRVPEGLTSAVVGVALYRCEGLKRPPAHVTAAAESGAVVICWGKPAEVDKTAAHFSSVLGGYDVARVDYFIRPTAHGLPGQDLFDLKKLGMCIVSDRGHRRCQV